MSTTPRKLESRALAVLASRTLLFALWQAGVAALLALAGSAAPWEASAAWWPWTAALTNLVSIGLLVWLLRGEGRGYWEMLRFERASWKGDLLVVLGLLALSAPLGILPSLGLGLWLFGDPNAPVALMFRPLPQWAAWGALAAFPLSIALAELPTYFGYAMPRLGPGLRAPLLAAFFLAVQHATLPLLFDWRFAFWRAGMFLPFALLLAFALRRRPRLLPYLAIMHGLLDLQAAAMVISASA